MAPVRKLNCFVRPVLGALLLVGACLGPLGCGPTAAVKHARLGDVPALRRDLDEAAAAGKLDAAALRDVGQALLEHDLARFGGDDGVRRVDALAGCARPLKGALRKTAEGQDPVAGAAALLLVDLGLVDVDAYLDHKDSSEARFRAAATRGLVGGKHSELRLARLHDDDRWVRRAAVDAAAESASDADVAGLLVVARKDPDHGLRAAAVRALGRAAARLSSDAARAVIVDALRDLWAGNEDSVRSSIARTFAAPALLPVGGLRELEAAIGREEGHATVEAASALMGAGGSDGAMVLEKLAKTSDLAVKLHVFRLLDPQRPSHLELLQKAAAPAEKGMVDDVAARTLAAEMLLRVPSEREKALATLVALTARDDKLGSEAALALADVGDARGKPRLVKDLGVPSFLRYRAASALVRLGAAADVRVLLATEDMDVRDTAACAVLGTH